LPIEPIDAAPEVIAALQEAARASRRLLQALKSPDYRQQHRRVMQEWLAAEQRRREAWLAMATPLPTPE
jgi:hypothetical protein